MRAFSIRTAGRMLVRCVSASAVRIALGATLTTPQPAIAHRPPVVAPVAAAPSTEPVATGPATGGVSAGYNEEVPGPGCG